jgi:phenylacetate-CoA ligase
MRGEETFMTPDAYTRGFDAAVRALVTEATERVPAFAARLGDAGLTAADVSSADDLARLPTLWKDRLLEIQQAAPPFGGLVAADAPVRRVFQSPGPLYEPEMDRPDPWRWGPALEAAGFGRGDLVLNAFGYHLSPAGAMFEEAARALGARVAPAGVGNRALQAQLCRDAGVTAYIGLPSYLKALLEEAGGASEEGGTWRLDRAFVSAEPLPPTLRSWLTERVATVRQGYGTAETGNLAYECQELDGLHVADDALVQICDPETGEPRTDTSAGQVVVTLFDAAYPLVRFGTGDLSAFISGECPCGRGTPRLVGILGRLGEAVKVRGLFLHPRQLSAAMAGVRGIDRWRFLVDRVDHRDVLRCEIVTTADAATDPSADVRARVRDALRFDVEVDRVDAIPVDASPIEDLRDWA